LQAYDWPGNVRQLENVCRRLALVASGREIRVADLPPNLKAEPAEKASGFASAKATLTTVQAQTPAYPPRRHP